VCIVVGIKSVVGRIVVVSVTVVIVTEVVTEAVLVVIESNNRMFE
jgi:hypothetical protein